MNIERKLAAIDSELQSIREELLNHSVYELITDLSGLRIFMESHVYAVWDFMSLLKRLQHAFTPSRFPWIPPAQPRFARMINEIVLAEESDENGEGGFGSHFDLYRSAMKQCGADTSRLDCLLSKLSSDVSFEESLSKSDVPESARNFMRFTIDLANSGSLVEVASSFTFGREDLLPGIFQKMVDSLANRHPGKLDRFQYYLQRHIDLDGDSHGPLAMSLVSELCGVSEENWHAALEVAVRSLQVRKEL